MGDPPNVRFFIDQPTNWSELPACVIIRGWCFSSNGRPVTGVRLCAGDRTFYGVIGLSRPDVKAALPDAPGDDTGFEIRGTLPGGRRALILEAQIESGPWTQFLTKTVQIRRSILPRWLGGGERTEQLMFFQMPAHMAYPARPVQMEKFPAAPAMDQPRFSIVTPSFNQARFLEETIRSVLEQNAPAGLHYVVQDGGSTDGCVEILRRYAAQGEVKQERRPEAGNAEQGMPSTDVYTRDSTASKVPSPSSLLPSPGAITPSPSTLLPAPAGVSLAWSSEADGGQADAIQKGFAKTTGAPDDVMAWLNSDDFYLPGALGFVAEYFARHPDVDVIYGHRIVVNEESQEIARWFLPKHDPEVLCLNDFVPQETMFWRRRIWDKVGGLDTAFKFAMDWDLLLRFQAAGAKIVRVPYFLACFRVHSAQKTSARMHDLGQKEINLLRERTQGRPFPPEELERDPRLLRYLRKSAFIEWLWRLGIRAP